MLSPVRCSTERAIVVGAANLVDFRTLAERGVDVPNMIADYSLAQLAERNGGNQGD